MGLLDWFSSRGANEVGGAPSQNKSKKQEDTSSNDSEDGVSLSDVDDDAPIEDDKRIDGIRYLLAEKIVDGIITYVGLIIAVAAPLVAVGRIDAKEFFSVTTSLIGSFITLVATIVGFYFGGKSNK